MDVDDYDDYEAEEVQNCTANEPLIELRFYLVSIFGSFLATAGVLSNLLLAWLFLSRSKFRHSSAFLLALVAVCDVLMDACYILLFPVSIAYEFLQNVHMFRLWYSYVRVVFTIGHIAGNASSYMLIGAAYERYKVTGSWTLKHFTTRWRLFIAFCALAFAMLVKLSLYWERVIYHHVNCTQEIMSLQLAVAPLVYQNPLYRDMWTFWIRELLSAFFPFFALCGINLAIVSLLKNQRNTLNLRERFLTLAIGADAASNQKKQVRSATQTLVVISATHLMGHLLNVCLAGYEMVNDFEPTEFMTTTAFAIIIELSSILRISSNVVRLPIYWSLDTKIRKELKRIFERPSAITPNGMARSKLARHNSGIYQ